jgi:predicted aconitase with swiveling domain
VSADSVILRGRAVIAGVAEGEALVSTETLSGWGGVDPRTGTIIETRHPLRGQSFRDKVLVIRGAKGSSGWSSMFHLCRLAGTAPRALVFNEMTTKIALGAVVMRIPAVTELECDPLTLVQSGDWVLVDGNRGLVEIRKNPPGSHCRAGAMEAQTAG